MHETYTDPPLDFFEVTTRFHTLKMQAVEREVGQVIFLQAEEEALLLRLGAEMYRDDESSPPPVLQDDDLFALQAVHLAESAFMEAANRKLGKLEGFHVDAVDPGSVVLRIEFESPQKLGHCIALTAEEDAGSIFYRKRELWIDLATATPEQIEMAVTDKDRAIIQSFVDKLHHFNTKSSCRD